jgi:hypothetical protein
VNKLITLIAAALFMLPTLSTFAEDTPPAGEKPKTPAEGGEGNRGRDGFMKRMIAENPELEGVDLNSPEGQEKIRGVMQKRMEAEAPRIRQRMAEGQVAQHAELNKQMGMTQEEFDAIKPLLVVVENLRSQKGLVDNSASRAMIGGAFGGGNRGRNNFFNPQMLLGDTQLDPTVTEIQEAVKALKALVDDKQANATELTSAVARLRKAREGFAAVLEKAQKDLRAVLTPQQEAMLVDRGTLE